MPLLAILIALFLPRVVIVLLWLFTQWFSAFPNTLLGILGFLFLPYTLLWYTAVQHWFGGTWGILQIIVLVIAVAADLGVTGGSQYRK